MASQTATSKRWRQRFYSVGLVVLAGIVVSPFLWLVLMSFKTNADILSLTPKIFFSPTLANYAALLSDTFLRSFANSTIVSVFSTAIAMLVGVPGAYALSRMSHRSGTALSLVILASRLAPPIAFTIPYFLVYRYTGLLDTLPGLILIYLTFNLSLVVWLMRSYFDDCPRSLEEAAWIDGATLMQTFLKITLPIALPGLAATAILCFLYSWNDFFFALILTRRVAQTAPVAVVNFMNLEGWEWGKIAAGGTMVMLPVLIFSLVVRKFLIQGMTAGAVKG